MVDPPGRGMNGDPKQPGVLKSILELKAFFFHYLAVQADKLLLIARNIAVVAVLGIVAALIGVTFVITATVYLCVGIVDGLEKLFGNQYWIGPLLFGLVTIVVIAFVTIVFIRRLTAGSKERLVAAYERRRREQQTEFGTDVRQQAGRAGVN